MPAIFNLISQKTADFTKVKLNSFITRISLASSWNGCAKHDETLPWGGDEGESRKFL